MVQRIFLPLAILGFFLINESCFVVPQASQALVLQFGRLVSVIRKPGLYFKIPLLQEFVRYDKRILSQDILPIEVTLGDQKRALVDMFMRYRIQDPVLFFKTVRNEAGANSRLVAMVSGILRNTLGHHTLTDLLSQKRSSIMQAICLRANQAVKPLGLRIVDARILRADLPPANSLAIFSRMISERQKEAREIRAHGQEKQQIIKVEANLQGELILAKALEQSAAVLGEGEQAAQEIYRKAYAQNPGFAHLYQTLKAYKKAFTNGKTTYILNTAMPFLRYFQNTSSKVKKH